jgi:Immunity protein 7
MVGRPRDRGLLSWFRGFVLSGYGWCVLATPRTSVAAAVELEDQRADVADAELRTKLRMWMAAHSSPWLKWELHDHLNNDSGVLVYALSRNHRSSEVWAMLDWIATNGTASYGLLYIHDDEDSRSRSLDQQVSADYSNVYRVHRLMHGVITEFDDPFFGDIIPNLRPD